MVHINHHIDRFQQAIVNGFYLFLKIFLSIFIGVVSARCSVFENFSPFTLILLSVSPDISLIPTFCYLGSAFGILTTPFGISVFKYLTALTMLYVVYMVFRRSLHIIKNDTAILSGACCFIAGFIFLLVDRITLFGVLVLLGESVLICCCIYFINYAVRGVRQCCFLSSREIIAAAVSLTLILVALHDVYFLSMSTARIVALILLFLAISSLKTSHTALVGTCIGIVLAAVGNGGEAIFTATVVSTLAACVFSSFSDRFARTSFVIIYYAVLFFFGKFPWNYWYFTEPLIAYTITFFVPKKKLRALLSPYIAVKSSNNMRNNASKNQLLLEACRQECCEQCPKADLCYTKNISKISDVLEIAVEHYVNTKQLCDTDSLSFCIRPNTMKEIIERVLIMNFSSDFDDLIQRFETLSKEFEHKISAQVSAVRFLENEEKIIKEELTKKGLYIQDVCFIKDEHNEKKCEIKFSFEGDVLYDKILRDTASTLFPEGYTINIREYDQHYCAKIKERSRYKVSCSALCKTKNGEEISGDNALGFSVGRDNYYLILSDGMGSGKEADMQSTALVQSLKYMLSGGLSVTHALNIYRSSSRFRHNNSFTTIDICAIDLKNGIIDFYKSGAYDSFHLHNMKINVLRGGGLPFGLTERDQLKHHNIKIHSNDTIIMATDGLSVLGEKINKTITDCYSDDIRQYAKNLLLATVEKNGRCIDDITVMVCKIQNSNE